MASYVAQGKESFTGELDIPLNQSGVLISTNQVVRCEVFDYFGKHRFFDAVASASNESTTCVLGMHFI